MIRVGDLNDYKRLDPETEAPFLLDMPRPVRLTFNAPYETPVWLHERDPEGKQVGTDPIFLAVVHGLQMVEFYAHGSFAVTAEGTVYIKTIDGATIHTEDRGEESLIRDYERAPRNPQLEQFQAMLLRNQERRMGEMLYDLNAERSALARERAALDARAHSDGVAGKEPQSSGGSADKGDTGGTAPGEGDAGGEA